MNAEEQSLAEGTPRVKFGCRWVGKISDLLSKDPEVARTVRQIQNDLADALLELEDVGATPVCFDGKVGGNAAALFTMDNVPYIIVSKSGKLAERRMDLDTDFCIIKSFDADNWSSEYYACDATVLPTSDTPLHFYGLLKVLNTFNWAQNPQVVLHGHALETEEAANRLGFPISVKETLFSTREDVDALMDLMAGHPYPENKIFIRKGHGFLLFDSDVNSAVQTFRAKMKQDILKETRGTTGQ